MEDSKEIFLEISTSGDSPKIFLKLPADAWEIEDALMKARVDDGRSCCLSNFHIRCRPYLSLSSTDIYEANFLAERLAGLDDIQMKSLNAMRRTPQYSFPSTSELINMTYNLDKCNITPNVPNNEALGRLVMAKAADIPESCCDLLNYEQIGYEHRKKEGGVIEDDLYIVPPPEIPQIYGGIAPLPAPMPHSIELHLRGSNGDTAIIKLPCDEDTALETFHSLDNCRIVNYRCRARVECRDLLNIGKIHHMNALADKIAQMDIKELRKFNALLRAKMPGRLESIMELAQTQDGYEFHPDMFMPEDYGRAYLELRLGVELMRELEKFIDLEEYGRHLMPRGHMEYTDYGLVGLTEGFETLLKQTSQCEPEAEPEQEYGYSGGIKL